MLFRVFGIIIIFIFLKQLINKKKIFAKTVKFEKLFIFKLNTCFFFFYCHKKF